VSDVDPNDFRPWEQPGAVRRDREPHRGPLLLLLGRIGSLCAMLTPVLVVPGVVGLSLGLTVWLLAGADLAKMRAGLMDPAGRQQSERARWHGLVAALFAACWLVIAVTLLVRLLG
jgi:hypothetical protein